MGLIFTDGEMLAAVNTRAAFSALSDQLEAEGHPPIIVSDGDRDPAEQLRIWHERFIPLSSVSPGQAVYEIKWWNGVQWARISDEGTVGIPGTSEHEFFRAADLAAPYNYQLTAGHIRAQQLCGAFDIRWSGADFGEDWHWAFRGDVGQISASLHNINPALLEASMLTMISCPLPRDPSRVSHVWITESGGAGSVTDQFGMASILRKTAGKIVDFKADQWHEFQFCISHAWERAGAAAGLSVAETNRRIDQTLSELDAPMDATPVVLDRLARNLLNGLGDDLSADLADRLSKGRR